VLKDEVETFSSVRRMFYLHVVVLQPLDRQTRGRPFLLSLHVDIYFVSRPTLCSEKNTHSRFLLGYISVENV